MFVVENNAQETEAVTIVGKSTSSTSTDNMMTK